MIVHNDTFFHIYFGDAKDAMYPEAYLNWHDMAVLVKQPQIKPLMTQLGMKQLFFLHQTHSTDGYTITHKTLSLQPFAYKGDYIITDQPLLGVGVVTADCLPVICVDTRHRAIGIAHAGWRGAVGGVVQAMLTAMEQAWQTRIEECRFFLGPSARHCCYQVGPEFKDYLAHYPWHQHVLVPHTTGYWLDVPLLVQYQLYDQGIEATAINNHYNTCTMCNDRFYSHRRGMLTNSAPLVGRQMTIVALKKPDC